MPRSPRPRTGNLRIKGGSNSSSQGSSSRDEPLTYTNRLGKTYYLHQGTTKTGNPRYFVARSIRAEALLEMPTGFEFTESINGVVSVRRINELQKAIPESEIELVRSSLLQHKHLESHQVYCRNNEIVIYEPRGGFSDRCPGLSSAPADWRIADLTQRKVRYDPVMKFVPSLSDSTETYTAFRMSYRGEGGWLLFSIGRLENLADKYVRRIGTDDFFEIM